MEFAGGERTKDFVFEEEYIDIPQGVIDNDRDQDPIPDIVQEVITDQDTVIEPPIQVVQEEQNQQPQEPSPLRRSTRERKNAISDDYIIFL